MVVWGGLYPIREQLVYDIGTIIGWIYTTTIVIRQSISIMTMPTNRRDVVKSNNKIINQNNVKDYQFHTTYSTWYVILVLFISSVGTILVTSRGTLTNRWTMTLPMIPLLVLHSCIYLLSLYQQYRRKWYGSNISIYIKIIFSILSFLCIICILLAILLSILFPAVELPPIIQSTNNNYDSNTFYPSIGVIDFYIPIPSYDKDNNTTTIDDLNSCVVSSTTDESSCTADDIVHNNNNNKTLQKQKYLPVRLLYPTKYVGTMEWSVTNDMQSIFRWILQFSMKKSIPYLNVITAIEFCRHSMRFGAPDPIKKMGWILHTWRLITLPLIMNGNGIRGY